jgi:hypothetical protein
MKALLQLLTFASLLLFQVGCSPDSVEPLVVEPQEQQKENPKENRDDTMPDEIKISVSGKTLPVKIEDNVATRALVEALAETSITYEADDYGGFEKVGALGRTLPSDNKQISTSAGDVVLYNSSNIVLFYGSNSWSYTRIGKIQYGTLDELESFLKAGSGKISVTLSL